MELLWKPLYVLSRFQSEMIRRWDSQFPLRFLPKLLILSWPKPDIPKDEGREFLEKFEKSYYDQCCPIQLEYKSEISELLPYRKYLEIFVPFRSKKNSSVGIIPRRYTERTNQDKIHNKSKSHVHPSRTIG